MARAFPNSAFVGSDYHSGSIDIAQDTGVQERVLFELRPAASYTGTGYDLVTMFDCLHNMGYPIGAVRHVHSTLKPTATSTPWAAPTTPSQPCCAHPCRSPRTSGSRSAHKRRDTHP
jgi:hypothetical protein